MRHITGVLVRGTAGALLSTVLLAGCGGGAGDDGDPKTLVVATHDSWAMSKKVLAKFVTDTGLMPKMDSTVLTPTASSAEG